ncbi:MAG: exodeoxyribonuclease VII large subunit, partial [Clostridia bacterium]|nr:exodeoxyribonuclease VII large subunit [Clostridia bacterium]
MSDPLVLTVSQLNTYIKGLVETDGALRSVYVSGEISNFVHHAKSGHCYFTLKDAGGVLKAVMFRPFVQKMPFEPQNGMKVV